VTALPGIALGIIVAGALLALVVSAAGFGPVISQPVPLPRLRDHSALGFSALGAAVVALIATRWIAGGALTAAAVWFAPRVVGGRNARARAIARTEAIAAWAEMLRDTLAGAAGLEETIVATTRIAPDPIRFEVRSLGARLEHQALPEALRAFAEEMADPTADLVASALSLAATSPTRNLGALLGTLAASARAQASLQLRIDAGRARTRSAVRIVTGFTVCFAVGMVVLNRGYLEPFDTLFGQLVLAAIGACFAGAFVMLAHMAQTSTPERVLVRGVRR